MTITESIKFNKVKEENEKLKKELAEKDRKIDLLLTANKEITYSTKSREYNQQQLYKEDFVIYSFGCDKCNLIYSCKNKCKLFWALKDNSKYDKLPSKEDKTCI